MGFISVFFSKIFPTFFPQTVFFVAGKATDWHKIIFEKIKNTTFSNDTA
jgi:hypothetical protein